MTQILAEFSSNEHVLRPQAPRVQLLLYGDYACPLTATHDLAIRGALGATPEDVAYIYRHFPRGPDGRRAAECAVAAANQHRFWDMHARLLVHQASLDDASLVEHALSLHLDIGRFLKDLAGPAPRAKVMADSRHAHAAGVIQTPSIFVQGQLLAADVTVEQVLSRIAPPNIER